MEPTKKFTEFLQSLGMPEDAESKALKLFKDRPAVGLTPEEASAGGLWAFISLNQIFDTWTDEESVAEFFSVAPERLELAREFYLEEVSLLDPRYLMASVAASLDGKHPVSKVLAGKGDIDKAFEEAFRIYEDEDMDSAKVGFLLIFNHLYEHKDQYSTEDFLAYTLIVLSNLGNLYWDEQNLGMAWKAFQSGAKVLSSIFEGLGSEPLDVMDRHNLPIFFMLEDIAALSYAMEDIDRAKTYYALLAKIDATDQFQATVALECLNAGKTWEEYCDISDAMSPEHHCHCGNEHCGEGGCDCDGHDHGDEEGDCNCDHCR